MKRDALPADIAADSFWRELAAAPHAHDWFQAMRWIDARGGARHRLGHAPSPRDEPVRVGQAPSLAFAPSMLADAQPPSDQAPARLTVFGFGLFGPNGPLPLHLTEHAYERQHHHGDSTLTAFADMLHHRLALLFYRAWADAQGTVSLDREDERFTARVASLLHLGGARPGDGIGDHAKLFMSGHLVRQTRSPEGLRQILQHYFDVPIRIREFVPQWIRLPPSQCLALGGPQGLGGGSVLGVAVRDAQHKFRIEIGPLRLARYRDFLPGGRAARQLLHWVRHYLGLEYAWDVRPLLDPRDAQGMALGGDRALGLATWLGKRAESRGDAGDLVIDYEARSAQPRRACSSTSA